MARLGMGSGFTVIGVNPNATGAIGSANIKGDDDMQSALGSGAAVNGGSLLQQTTSPLAFLMVLLGVLLVWKFVTEHDETVFEPADVGISLPNTLAVGTMALVFLVLGKYVTARFIQPETPFSGLSTIFAAA